MHRFLLLFVINYYLVVYNTSLLLNGTVKDATPHKVTYYMCLDVIVEITT